MGPRACSILGTKGRFFAYGIRRENNDMDLISKQASKHASTQTSKQTSKQARKQGDRGTIDGFHAQDTFQNNFFKKHHLLSRRRPKRTQTSSKYDLIRLELTSLIRGEKAAADPTVLGPIRPLHLRCSLLGPSIFSCCGVTGHCDVHTHNILSWWRKQFCKTSPHLLSKLLRKGFTSSRPSWKELFSA